MASITLSTFRHPSLLSASRKLFARTSLQLQCRLLPRARQSFAPIRHMTVQTYGPEHRKQGNAEHSRAARYDVYRSHSTSAKKAQDMKGAFEQKHEGHGQVTTKKTKDFTRTTHTARATLDEEPSRLTPYELPNKGLLSILPASWVPYAELIRLDKPTGTYYLFLPCLFSTLLAAPLADPVAPPLTVFGMSSLFFLGALIMRGAGCTVNDLWDRNLDPHVERTRLRPIARGAISVQQAIPFLGFQLLAGLGVLVSLPTQCLWYGIPSLLLVATYPLAKRVTNYPQVVLGLTFSWGAIMGFPALGIDLLAVEKASALIAAACLYTSCVAWTVVYDMIYAYQDIRDDAVAGIKSIALAQQKNAKIFLTTVASLQVGLLATAGFYAGAGPVFFVGSCGGAVATLGYMIKMVDLADVKDCWRWFRKGAWFTGGVIAFGLAGEYAVQYVDVAEDDDNDSR